MAARNSWKHGLLAKSAVIMLGPAKENKAEFEELLSGLRDYFAPVGAAEELLVEEIAVSYWISKTTLSLSNLAAWSLLLTREKTCADWTQ